MFLPENYETWKNILKYHESSIDFKENLYIFWNILKQSRESCVRAPTRITTTTYDVLLTNQNYIQIIKINEIIIAWEVENVRKIAFKMR
jgi:hypothetical protein